MKTSQFSDVIKDSISRPDAIYWKDHALARMRQRGITVDDILAALTSGAIIEEYRTDKPFPSVLVNGNSTNGRPIHVVCGINASCGEIHIVTGYEPDHSRWDEHYSVRKEK